MKTAHLVRPPSQDEALSSWLYRQSLIHGLPPQSYTSITFPGVQFWTRDVDRWIPVETASELSRRTGLSRQNIQSMTLAHYRSVVGKIQPDGAPPWVLAAGVYHRRRRRHGQQFCLDCLGERQWRLSHRLAYSTCCDIHKSTLFDGCPYCDSPLSVFYLDPDHPLTCQTCGQDMRRFKCFHRPINTLRFSIMHRFQHRAWIREAGFRAPDPPGVRALMRLQLQTAQGRRWHSHWAREAGIEPAPRLCGRLEFSRIKVRTALIVATECALLAGRGQLLETLAGAGVGQATFSRSTDLRSPWLQTEILPHLASTSITRQPKYRLAELSDPLLVLARRGRNLPKALRAEARSKMIESIVRTSSVGVSQS